MKKAVCLLLCLLIVACTAVSYGESRHTYSFYDAFDTVIILTGYTDDEALFNEMCRLCEEEFRRLDKLFTQYRSYSGVNNVYLLNREAAKAPVPVDEPLFNLLLRCREAQKQIPDTVNVAMGSVLSLWHDARVAAENSEASLPDSALLQAAAKHCSMDDLILDEATHTVFYADPALQLDLGAVAKGYAAGWVAAMVAQKMPKFAINAGGNIVTGDAPDNNLGLWKSGIQSPDAFILSGDYLAVVAIKNRSLVTSGDYQRYYYVGDKRYHHIISPQTLMPADTYRAVSILEDDPFMADFLSTAAFLLPYKESRALIDSLPHAEALWVMADGTITMTDGFAACKVQ